MLSSRRRWPTSGRHSRTWRTLHASSGCSRRYGMCGGCVWNQPSATSGMLYYCAGFLRSGLSVKLPDKLFSARKPKHAQHGRDPTRVNLACFSKLTELELRGTDLSTSAWLGLAEVQPSLQCLTCCDSLEELQHLLAPYSRLVTYLGGPMLPSIVGSTICIK